MPSCFTVYPFRLQSQWKQLGLEEHLYQLLLLICFQGPAMPLTSLGSTPQRGPHPSEARTASPPVFPLPPDLLQSCPVMTHVKFFAILSQKVLRYKTLIQSNLEQIAKMSHSLGPIRWVKLLEDRKFVCFTSALHYEFLGYSISVKDFLNCTDNTQRKEASQYYHFFLEHSRSSPHLVLDNMRTGCIQLFRLMFHIKECICKM